MSTKSFRTLMRALSATIAVTIILVMVAAAGHTHRDGQETTNCALCAIAHTPATQTASAPAVPSLERKPVERLIVSTDVPEDPAPVGNSPRAPPSA
jgi:hypothetical protein